jgi:hypothetical protein
MMDSVGIRDRDTRKGAVSPVQNETICGQPHPTVPSTPPPDPLKLPAGPKMRTAVGPLSEPQSRAGVPAPWLRGGSYLAYTTHVPRMYLACTSQSPPKHLACTTHIPGFEPLSAFCILHSFRRGFERLARATASSATPQCIPRPWIGRSPSPKSSPKAPYRMSRQWNAGPGLASTGHPQRANP